MLKNAGVAPCYLGSGAPAHAGLAAPLCREEMRSPVRFSDLRRAASNGPMNEI
jgi:hypothetical protein